MLLEDNEKLHALTSIISRKSLVRMVKACGSDGRHLLQCSSNWFRLASAGIPKRNVREWDRKSVHRSPRYCPIFSSSIFFSIGPAFLPSAIRFNSIHRRSPEMSEDDWAVQLIVANDLPYLVNLRYVRVSLVGSLHRVQHDQEPIDRRTYSTSV